mmetsp:Transcript_12456/g.25012  ORF Transcript_12456/g.25012 Transcript_12456/m.25012 type:complete len:138 (-) Transcript_12456:50-463(-)
MAPRTDKYTDKAVEMCIATDCTPRAAYDAVKAAHRNWGAGEEAIQNIRKRAREGREKAAPARAKKPAKKKSVRFGVHRVHWSTGPVGCCSVYSAACRCRSVLHRCHGDVYRARSSHRRTLGASERVTCEHHTCHTNC